MKNLIWPCATLLLGLSALPAAAQPTRGNEPPMIGRFETSTASLKPEALPAEDARRLSDAGAKIFGIKWSAKLVAVSYGPFRAVTDGVTSLSYRSAGNAYFVQRAKGRSGDPGFQGSNDALLARAKALAGGLGIDPAEIAQARILQEYISAGFIDPSKRITRVEKPVKDRRTVLMTRAVRGIPVWSSKLALDLDSKGNIVSAEVSWPEISARTLEAAENLSRIVAPRFKAPDLAHAKVEAVQAGIIHSPAASFLDDQVATIRVIYAPTDPRVGKKPVLYLGADGRPVAMPRMLNMPREPEQKPRGAAKH